MVGELWNFHRATHVNVSLDATNAGCGDVMTFVCSEQHTDVCAWLPIREVPVNLSLEDVCEVILILHLGHFGIDRRLFSDKNEVILCQMFVCLSGGS